MLKEWKIEVENGLILSPWLRIDNNDPNSILDLYTTALNWHIHKVHKEMNVVLIECRYALGEIKGYKCLRVVGTKRLSYDIPATGNVNSCSH